MILLAFIYDGTECEMREAGLRGYLKSKEGIKSGRTEKELQRAREKEFQII